MLLHLDADGNDFATTVAAAGFFTLYAVSHQPDLFEGVIASSPALWWNGAVPVREFARRLTRMPPGSTFEFRRYPAGAAQLGLPLPLPRTWMDWLRQLLVLRRQFGIQRIVCETFANGRPDLALGPSCAGDAAVSQ